MRISVTAKPNAKTASVEQTDERAFVVAVKAPAKSGKANAAVACALASHFKLSPSRVRLVSGQRGKRKTFEIL